MKARLIKDRSGQVLLLHKNGTYSKGSVPLLAKFITDFKDIDFFDGADGSWRKSVADMAFYPGDTLAIISDDLELIIYSGEAFKECFEESLAVKDFVTSEEYAEMYDKTREIVKVYCREGRIPGAQKVGRAWMIPRNAPYPVPTERQRPKTCGPRSSAKEE